MSKKRLLIVDDEEAMRHMLSSMLRKEDYVVISASNGHDALKLMTEDVYDIILCDIREHKILRAY